MEKPKEIEEKILFGKSFINPPYHPPVPPAPLKKRQKFT